jgi:hypothetical protein
MGVENGIKGVDEHVYHYCMVLWFRTYTQCKCKWHNGIYLNSMKE